ncbi:MAG: U32 family peptidase [Clostridiaceae bacterium]|nr:U32 family peptidase [Clostridiaceae bacterium]
MKNKRAELLAPAGSPEAYRAAVAAGADAVYLGAKAFNARINAGNFDNKALSEVIKDAHTRGVKVYLVLNTLIADKELEEARQLASFAYNEGIDGIIVQDIGLIEILKETAPGLPIHASTQMTIHNTDGVRAAQALGISRVVLARELSLTEIESIIRNTGIEVEIFIHGALCICRSGQCLLSSFIGGRSGNRGRCAQPCRLPYRIDGLSTSGDYLLSPKDLMTLGLLPDILNTGVAALKIEGRMKSPEYVAATVMIYRKYLDLAMSDPSSYRVECRDIRILEQVFNRGGFTAGYLKGMDKRILSIEHPKHRGIRVGTVAEQDKGEPRKFFGGRNDRLINVRLDEQVSIGDGIEIWDRETLSAIVSVMIKDGEHVKSAGQGDLVLLGNFKSFAAPGSPVYKTYDKELMEYLSGFAAKNVPTVPVTGEFRLFAGEKPLLSVADKSGNTVHVEGAEPSEEAVNKPLTEERIAGQLKKTGDTPYYFENIKVLTDNSSFVPVSLINEMRRDALSRLSEKRRDTAERYFPAEKKYFPGNAQVLSEQRKISVFFYKTPPAELRGTLPADRVYLKAEAFDAAEEFRNAGTEVFAAVPAVLTDKQMDMYVKKIASVKDKIDGILAGNLGALHRMREEFPDIPAAVDFTMNIFNTPAAVILGKYKPSGIMPSLELNFEALVRLRSPGILLEACVYGAIPVMTLEYCPASNNGSCGRKCGTCMNRQGYLADSRGKRFLYITDPVHGRTTLYNSSILMADDVSPFEKTDVKILRIGIMDESPGEIRDICAYYRDLWIDGRKPGAEHRNLLLSLKSKNLTRGHYHRGVE